MIPLTAIQIPALRKALKRKEHIAAQAITGIKPYVAIRIALPRINGCQKRIFNNSKMVKTQAAVKEIINLY